MIEHYYQTVDGWFTFPRFYKQIVEQAKDGYHVVEVGSWKGKSAIFMAVEIANSGKLIKFDCVDTWKGSSEHLDKNSPFYEPLLLTPDGLYNHFMGNITRVKKYINPIRKSSLEASALYEDNSLNCVFIDASHEYHDVCEDIKHWLPKIKKGGLLAGHDIAHPPIQQALKDTLKENYKDIGEDVWIYKVSAQS